MNRQRERLLQLLSSAEQGLTEGELPLGGVSRARCITRCGPLSYD